MSAFWRPQPEALVIGWAFSRLGWDAVTMLFSRPTGNRLVDSVGIWLGSKLHSRPSLTSDVTLRGSWEWPLAYRSILVHLHISPTFICRRLSVQLSNVTPPTNQNTDTECLRDCTFVQWNNCVQQNCWFWKASICLGTSVPQTQLRSVVHYPIWSTYVLGQDYHIPSSRAGSLWLSRV